jgi:alanine racemase
VSGRRLPDWDQLAATIPDVVATMRAYLDQLDCILRPGSVGGADQALRSLAAFLTEHAPQVLAVAEINRSHLEGYRRWLAARPGYRTSRLTPATLAHRLGTLRMFFVRYRHLANSAAALTRPETHFDLVRAGTAIYGLSPMTGERLSGLRPAMTARARVIHTKRVPAGHGVSYSHTYHTSRETTLAVVPIGYADGVPRAASNGGLVRLGGRARTIAGRVCMDQLVIDCGDDPVAPGDVVVLFGQGDDGAPTANDWADVVGTINNEVVFRFGTGRLRRVYEG